ncbi:glycosyltransferase [Dokdonia ponticola]|uniref:Glycosyltransferase n=1 Tax=Dokdonia ponticola TaxID=2041041 RepID=A0ABV9I0Z3_9FLAO
MQTIIEYCKHLNEVTPFIKRYPNYNLHDKKVHVLYVSPRLRSKDYYSSILPALELNKTTTHSAILSSIELEQIDADFFDYVDALDPRLLSWANYIVLPTILTDITYTIKIIRLLYPHLQIVMHLDDNYHKIPSWHINYKKIDSSTKKQLISNLNKIDICICQNNSLAMQYRSALSFYFKDVKCHLTIMPTLISRVGFENLKSINQNKDDSINIGVFHPSNKFLEMLPTLLKKLGQKGDKITFIIIDFKGDQQPYNSNHHIIFFKKIRFLDYFETLLKLQLRIALFNVSEYSTYDPTHYYLEVSALGIPSIACKNHPVASIIKDQEAGLLVLEDSDWKLHITTLLENENYRKRLVSHTIKTVWKNYSYTRKNLKRISSIFD